MSKTYLIALGLACAAGGSFAQSNIVVSATVSAACNVTANALSFGTYSPLAGAPVDVSTTVSVECSQGSVPKIELDGGQNFSAGRRMRLPATSNYLNYGIFQPSGNAAGAACAYTTNWGAGTAALTTTPAPSLAARSYNVCGRLPNGQDVPVGSYSDTVAVTIAF